MSQMIYVELTDPDVRRLVLKQLLSKELGRHSLTEKQAELVTDWTEIDTYVRTYHQLHRMLHLGC